MRALVVLGWGTAVWIATAMASSAAVFDVDTNLDGVDANLADGVCATAGGACSLRAAIMQSNTTAAKDTINVPAGVYRILIVGVRENLSVQGDFDILFDLDIIGAGPDQTIIDAQQRDRVFQIFALENQPRPTVTLEGLTIQNGFVTVEGIQSSGVGGGIATGNAILHVNNCVVQDNIAGFSGDGGGISGGFNTDLTITDSVIRGNAADLRGGGIYQLTGTITLVRSQVSDNRASGGGGIFVDQTFLDIRDSSIDRNLSYAGDVTGAGIMGFSGGPISLTNSTVHSNILFVGSGGAGIFKQGGDLDIVNSTISGNIAYLGSGAGGIFIRGGTVSMRNSTIANNSAAFGGGGLFVSRLAPTNLTVENSIVANNPGGTDCGGDVFQVNSLGYNLGGDGSCDFSHVTDLPAIPPMLGPLAANGGPTMTHALLDGSPAEDGGNPLGCRDPGGTLLDTDQRGIVRPQGEACDIGAFEHVVDSDGDGFNDDVDNCPNVFNDDQNDDDGDAVGDACDNCVLDANPRLGELGEPAREAFQSTTGGQLDDDADGIGNQCDAKFENGGLFVGALDLSDMVASFNRLREGDDCGASGDLTCARFDLDNAGLAIGANDLARGIQLFNTTPGPACDACPLVCVGPACP